MAKQTVLKTEEQTESAVDLKLVENESGDSKESKNVGKIKSMDTKVVIWICTAIMTFSLTIAGYFYKQNIEIYKEKMSELTADVKLLKQDFSEIKTNVAILVDRDRNKTP